LRRLGVSPTASFADHAQHANEFTWDKEVGNSTFMYEPFGVSPLITPWNYPL